MATPIGSEIDGRYRILAKLDEGGMGEVYLAEHMHLGRREAIKFLLPGLSHDAAFGARFRREARVLNRLSHPNIIAVYDFGRADDGRYFLAVEYAPGANLASVLALEGAMPLARASSVLMQLAEAVNHAHGRGVIHRDLKPANLVLVPRNHGDLVKVLDFGLAKIIVADDEGYSSTQGGGLRGTVSYLAPELFAGEPATAASDIYALGCIAWEVLTGRPAFLGRPVDVMEMHLHSRPPLASVYRITGPVPAQLEHLIQACLAKAPADRPPASGLIEVVANLVTDRVHDARRSQRLIVVPASLAVAAPVQDYADDEETSVTEGQGTDTQLDAGRAVTQVLPLADALAQYRSSLRGLAEAVLDRGGGDVQLGVELSRLGGLELELDRLARAMDDLEAESTATEQRTREREGMLRFAMGDLRFLRDEAASSAATSGADEQLTMLGSDLTRTLADCDRALAGITERQLEVVARAASVEQQILTQCRALDPVAERAAVACGADPVLRACRDQVATARALIRMAH